jgi:hypothetical protein
MKVCYTHCILRTCFTTLVAIFRELHYKRQIHRNVTEVNRTNAQIKILHGLK